MVRELTGREREDFETICRRYVAKRPEAIPSLRNKMGALSRLLRAMLMCTPDMDAFLDGLARPTAPTLSPSPRKKGSHPFQRQAKKGWS